MKLIFGLGLISQFIVMLVKADLQSIELSHEFLGISIMLNGLFVGGFWCVLTWIIEQKKQNN